MGEVIDDAVTRLGLEVIARVPDRTAVEQADVTRTPIAISAPDSAGHARVRQARRSPRARGGNRMNRPRRRGLQIDDPLGPGPSTHEQPTATRPLTDHTAPPHEDKAAERSQRRQHWVGSAARAIQGQPKHGTGVRTPFRHSTPADRRDRGSRRVRRPPLAGVDRTERRGQLPSAARAAGRTRRHRPGTAAADRDDRHRRDHTSCSISRPGRSRCSSTRPTTPGSKGADARAGA